MASPGSRGLGGRGFTGDRGAFKEKKAFGKLEKNGFEKVGKWITKAYLVGPQRLFGLLLEPYPQVRVFLTMYVCVCVGWKLYIVLSRLPNKSLLSSKSLCLKSFFFPHGDVTSSPSRILPPALLRRVLVWKQHLSAQTIRFGNHVKPSSANLDGFSGDQKNKNQKKRFPYFNLPKLKSKPPVPW